MGEEVISKMETAVLHASIRAKHTIFVLHGFGYGYRMISYFDLEFNPAIQTRITDMDMLQLRIDMALEAGDEGLFMKLTDQLKEVES